MKLSAFLVSFLLVFTSVRSSRFEHALLQIRDYLDGNGVTTYDANCAMGNLTLPEFQYPPEDNHVGGVKPKVQTTSGLLTGASLLEGNAFFNIPYAVPPVGDKRFTRPAPLTGSDGDQLDVSVKEMVACYQHCMLQNNSVFGNFTEDCLTLNVHTPNTMDLSDSTAPPSDRLPVLVWFYGGGFMTGSSNFAVYDGRYLSNASEVIVVGVNYRLGIFGFLAFNEKGEEVKGNQGFKDQQLALQWIQDNIEKFGGDKNQIAIVGQSAGAQAVMFHLMSEQSKPLFQRAILQSNPAITEYQTLDEAMQLLPYVLNSTNCNEGGIECLRSVDPHQLVQASYVLIPYYLQRHDIMGVIEPMRVILDGEEFTTDAMEAFNNGEWNTDKEVIMGTLVDEIYVPTFFPAIMPKTLYQSLVNFVFGEEIGAEASALYDQYAEGVGLKKDYRIPLGMLASDSFFKCPVRAMARLASQRATDNNIYLYSYTHLNMGPECNKSDISFSCGVASHSAENSLLFRTFDFVNYKPSDDDWLVSDQLGFYWSNMAKSGNPTSNQNNPVFATWPPYTEQVDKIAGFSKILNRRDSRLAESPWTNIIIDSPQIQLETNYMQDICDFWDSTGYYVNMTSSGGDVSSTTMAGNTDDGMTTANKPTTTSEFMTTTTTLAAEDTTSSSVIVRMSFVVLFSSVLSALFGVN